MELAEETYKLTRQLYRDAMRLVNGATDDSTKNIALVRKEHLLRLRDTLQELRRTRK